jgi:hypothetical protein
MALDYVNRLNDEEIIDIVWSILSNGNFEVETINESILCKLMELRGTPIKNVKYVRDVDEDYARWVSNSFK